MNGAKLYRQFTGIVIPNIQQSSLQTLFHGSEVKTRFRGEAPIKFMAPRIINLSKTPFLILKGAFVLLLKKAEAQTFPLVMCL